MTTGEQDSPAKEEPKGLGMWRIILIAFSSVFMALAIAGGSFASGIAQRKPEGEVRRMVSSAVEARAQQASEDQIVAVSVAKKEQRKADDKKWKKKLKKAVSKASRKAYKRGYAQGNSAGYSQGSSDGFSNGFSDGLYEGSDELVCSDDPDITWLPYCNW